MHSIGRNDPCPCGSGKKYKKCCGAKADLTADFGYARLRRFDGESAELLSKFARQRIGPHALEDAWEEFFPCEVVYSPDHPEHDFFVRWFTFNWRPTGEEMIAEMFLSQLGSKVDIDIRRFIDATLHAPYSYFQTLDVDPGVGMTLRDILRRREFHVTEKSASTVLHKGDIVFARIVELNEIAFFMGSGSVVIPSIALDSLLALRESVEKTARREVDSDLLLEVEEGLYDAYFRLAESAQRRKIDVRNSDGDPLALCTMHYTIESFERAFNALKGLELTVTRGRDGDLLDDKGDACINWLKKGKSAVGEGSVEIAKLRMSGLTLVAEVNSEKRARRVRKEIERRLGEGAVLERTEIESTEGLLKKSRVAADGDEPRGESDHNRLMRESPEAKALVQEMTERHWSTWCDVPVPALRGMTPRAAAKDPTGRELLDSLLLEFETRNNARKDDLTRVDVGRLRKELGL